MIILKRMAFLSVLLIPSCSSYIPVTRDGVSLINAQTSARSFHVVVKGNSLDEKYYANLINTTFIKNGWHPEKYNDANFLISFDAFKSEPINSTEYIPVYHQESVRSGYSTKITKNNDSVTIKKNDSYSTINMFSGREPVITVSYKRVVELSVEVRVGMSYEPVGKASLTSESVLTSDSAVFEALIKDAAIQLSSGNMTRGKSLMQVPIN